MVISPCWTNPGPLWGIDAQGKGLKAAVIKLTANLAIGPVGCPAYPAFLSHQSLGSYCGLLSPLCLRNCQVELSSESETLASAM